ncbi:hypothetical protein [Inquilinus sp. OTU3971]|uniref:hypothetical protein n=1 Tax=Inquilinus sp. OTU3971 TaxID=3043855 RepID=UPI00313EA974
MAAATMKGTRPRDWVDLVLAVSVLVSPWMAAAWTRVVFGALAVAMSACTLWDWHHTLRARA